MAKGQNHYSPKYEPPSNSILKILEQNSHYNLDPGGFTILLHFWTMISDSMLWMRLLPFLFFCLSVWMFSLICSKWRQGSVAAWFSGGLLLLSPLTTFFAFELRAYSLEILFTLLVLYTAAFAEPLKNRKNAIFYGLLLTAGMTARYSICFTVAIGVLIVLWRFFLPDGHFCRERLSSRTLMNVLLFGLPMVLAAACIYWFSYRHQIQIDYVRNCDGVPNYLRDHFFSEANMGKILANKRVFFFILPTLVMLQIYIAYAARFRFLKKYGTFIAFLLLLNIVTIGLSICEKATWDPLFRNNIGHHTLFLMAMAVLYFMLAEFCESKNLNIHYLAEIVILICLPVAVASCAWHYSFKLAYGYERLAPILRSGVKKIVAYTPDGRYAFEYGMFKEYKELYRNSTVCSTRLGRDQGKGRRSSDSYEHACYELFKNMRDADCALLGLLWAPTGRLIQKYYPDFKFLTNTGRSAILKKATLFRADITHQGGRRNLVEIESPGEDDIKFLYPKWLKNKKGEGLSVGGEVVPDYKNFSFTLKCRESGVFVVRLGGKVVFRDNKRQELVPDWVEYSSCKINGREMLADAGDDKPRAAWHREPVIVKFPAKAGETLRFEIRCRMKCVGPAMTLPEILKDLEVDPETAAAVN